MDQALEQTVFADLAHIEKTLTDDLSGERTRAMLSYFDQVTRSTEAHLQTALPDAERQLTSQLIEGFRASQRIVRHVWETIHTASLPA
ncbi:hypothetical protein [Roseateles terrae]|jgi:hypothetical protein|uniref:Uncharacterized protein n=1 Tax=Roseateles terrae TaxID=431060 RepID=A0ABR6GNN7_9BURK|nr:hypothetical protein [Roseateles terrae]MBB3193689.1 hypothetical protein [Roseateles terrae]OWQ89152.1 hypothetical protein CDN98_00950 [Roseateles terrae]